MSSPKIARAIELRPDYQLPLVRQIGEAMRRKVRRVLLQCAPGGGKTVMAAYIIQESAARGWSCYFNCHRVELAQQTSLTFGKFGIPHGFIAASHGGRPHPLVNICAIDTLKNRLATTPPPRLAIWDEAHHIGAAGWAAIMAAWPNTYHIGLTGTPWRLDGTGLGEFFDEMIIGPTVGWLIEHGHLSQYEIFAPSAPDMRGVKRVGGDYTKGEAAKRMDIPKRVGDIIAHWRREADGLRTVAYAINVADSKLIAERFNAAGIPAAHLDADSPKAERTSIIRDYAAGRLRVLSNVDLFGEGFDLSAIAQTDVTIDCAILARPTQSLSLYLQQIMRPMRPSPGKTAIILDHAGNSNRHGFPDDEREWSLAPREKSGKGGATDGPPPPVTCAGCFRQIKRPLPPRCPHCGKSLEVESKPVEFAEGELVRVTPEQRRAERERKDAERARLRQEEHEAKTLSQLVRLAVLRGYKNPQVWALKKFSASAERQRHAKRMAEAAA